MVGPPREESGPRGNLKFSGDCVIHGDGVMKNKSIENETFDLNFIKQVSTSISVNSSNKTSTSTQKNLKERENKFKLWPKHFPFVTSSVNNDIKFYHTPEICENGM